MLADMMHLQILTRDGVSFTNKNSMKTILLGNDDNIKPHAPASL
jgi:hypothetical protein